MRKTSDGGSQMAAMRLNEALASLRDDITRVEIWAGAMASFSQPVPDYDVSTAPIERYRLPASAGKPRRA